MSTMLEQAIIDASALKEAAVRNAESLIIEKYSTEIKETIDNLLEQEEDLPAAEPGEEAELSAPAKSVVDDLPLGATTEGSSVVSIDLHELEKELEEGDEPSADEMRDREDIANDIAADLEEPAAGAALDEDTEIDIDEAALRELLEDVTVDIAPQKSGWLETPTSEIETAVAQAEAAETHLDEDEEEVNESDEDSSELNEAIESLQNQINLLQEENEQYKQTILQLRDNVNEVNVQNARMLYTNQALGSNSLNGRQKNKIVEAISKASTVEEAKVIYETLQSAVGSTTTKRSSAPNSLSEAVIRRSSTRVSHSNQDKGPKDDPNLDRMKKLAGLN
jgi:hypothetical protein